MAESKNIYSIPEICERDNVTRNLLEKLWARGLGPKITRIGARVMVSAKAEKEWLEAMENPTGKYAEFAEQNRQMLSAKARRAGEAFARKCARKEA